MAKAVIKQKCVKDFKDYDFESCDVPEDCYGDFSHANFAKKYFLPMLRSELKKMAKNLGATVILNGNWFTYTGFFCKDGKYVYFSISDVRYFDWYGDVLYCEAASAVDFTGGVNRRCSYDELEECIGDTLC